MRFGGLFFFRFSCFKRTMMTSSSGHRQKALEQLRTNKYYEKYAEKIAKYQQENTSDEFHRKIDNLPSTQEEPRGPAIQESTYSKLFAAKDPLLGREPLITDYQTDDSSLDQIMKLDLINGKSTKEIGQIWCEYHKDKEYLAAVIPAVDYAILKQNAELYPTFLLPLPRAQGYEFIMCQFKGNSVHFAPLLYYQVHKENAPECLTLVHYIDLYETKKLVLLRGMYDTKCLTRQEAQCLANQLQLYYVRPNEARRRLLDAFNHQPNTFKHTDLIKEIESLSL